MCILVINMVTCEALVQALQFRGLVAFGSGQISALALALGVAGYPISFMIFISRITSRSFGKWALKGSISLWFVRLLWELRFAWFRPHTWWFHRVLICWKAFVQVHLRWCNWCTFSCKGHLRRLRRLAIAALSMCSYLILAALSTDLPTCRLSPLCVVTLLDVVHSILVRGWHRIYCRATLLLDQIEAREVTGRKVIIILKW